MNDYGNDCFQKNKLIKFECNYVFDKAPKSNYPPYLAMYIYIYIYIKTRVLFKRPLDVYILPKVYGTENSHPFHPKKIKIPASSKALTSKLRHSKLIISTTKFRNPISWLCSAREGYYFIYSFSRSIGLQLRLVLHPWGDTISAKVYNIVQYMESRRGLGKFPIVLWALYSIFLTWIGYTTRIGQISGRNLAFSKIEENRLAPRGVLRRKASILISSVTGWGQSLSRKEAKNQMGYWLDIHK